MCSNTDDLAERVLRALREMILAERSPLELAASNERSAELLGRLTGEVYSALDKIDAANSHPGPLIDAPTFEKAVEALRYRVRLLGAVSIITEELLAAVQDLVNSHDKRVRLLEDRIDQRDEWLERVAVSRDEVLDILGDWRGAQDNER